MRAYFSTGLLLAVILCFGCSQSGDFGPFIVAEVSKYGGHTQTAVAIPKVDARWTIKRDDDGFEILITDATFASIAAGMEQIFGPPKIADDGSGTAKHEPHSLWGAVDIGVAIQLIGHKDGTDLICLRGVKDLDHLHQLWMNAKP